MTSERVRVDLSQIKVGDLIYVEEPEGPDMKMYQGVITNIHPGSVETCRFVFSSPFNTARTFYRLPKPAPEEPKGLGAVVEDNEGDLWVKMTERWRTEDGDTNSTWEMLLENYGPVTVKHDGYIA